MTDTMETQETSTTADVWSVSLPAKDLGRVLRNAALFVSTDRKYPRPILQGVNVRFATGPARMIVEATDSYALWQDVITLPEPRTLADGTDLASPTIPTRSFILPAAGLAPIVKALIVKKYGPDDALVTFHGPHDQGSSGRRPVKVVFLVSGNTLVIETTDGDYPNIDADPDADPPRAGIWPSIEHKGLDPATISLNPAYLARFGKLVRSDGSQVGKSDGVRLIFHGPTRVIELTDADHRETWRGLLMPTRER